MSQPKIKVPLDSVDVSMEALGVVAVLLLLIYPGYYYSELPDIIPTHFNAVGEADGFSSKESIWTLPAIGTVLYFSLMLLGHFPHIFNYPKKITEENAERQYRLATKMMRIVNLITILIFCYLTYQTIEISLMKAEGLASSFVPIFLVGITVPVAVYIILTLRKPKSSNTSAVDSE